MPNEALYSTNCVSYVVKSRVELQQYNKSFSKGLIGILKRQHVAFISFSVL